MRGCAISRLFSFSRQERAGSVAALGGIPAEGVGFLNYKRRSVLVAKLLLEHFAALLRVDG